MANDYADIAKTTWAELPEPKILPDGSWLIRLRGARIDKAQEADKKDRVQFTYSVREPMDDVDVEALRALGDDYDVSINRVYYTVFIDDPSSWRSKVKRHIELHGVEVDESQPIAETLKAVRGKDVVAYLTTRTFQAKDGSQAEANEASNFTKVE